jgi:dolichyl-diphosphooligosaccharide--protein glycosyltransferase
VGDAKFEDLKRGLLPVVVVGAVAVFGGLYLSGKIIPWAGRFYALLDPTYAKKHIPIIASVSEHQPATWSSLFLDLHLLLFLIPLGIYYCFQKLDDAKIFAILFGVTSLYFTGIMVRLMLVLAPIACVLSAVAAGRVLSLYWGYMCQDSPENKTRKQISYLFFGFATFLAYLYVMHCVWAISEIYSEPQIVTSMKNPDGSLEVYDDFREAYRWLAANTPADTKVLAWWDYGYQLTAIANRTVIVDNNTWNFTQISLVSELLGRIIILIFFNYATIWKILGRFCDEW